MGKLALAAKITHVPSMYLSELDGPRKGTRQVGLDRESGRHGRVLVLGEYRHPVPAREQERRRP